MRLIRCEYPTLPNVREFDRLMNNLYGGFQRIGSSLEQAEELQAVADLYEDDTNVYARFELPGFKKNELGVNLENSVLTVTVERKGATEQDEDLSLSRSVTLPDGVDAEKTAAKYEDGILTVTLPKVAGSKPRTIEIK
jgi:HSP20 family protein